MNRLRIALALAVALASAWSAGAEPPPDEPQGKISLMTLLPIITPVSNYTCED